VQFAVFAPAFTLSFHDSECSRKPPNAHSLGRYVQQQKIKKSDFVYLKTIFQQTNI
jgi:hypothetical protein